MKTTGSAACHGLKECLYKISALQNALSSPRHSVVVKLQSNSSSQAV